MSFSEKCDNALPAHKYTNTVLLFMFRFHMKILRVIPVYNNLVLIYIALAVIPIGNTVIMSPS